MPRFTRQRAERNRLRFSAMGRRSQEIRRAKREAEIDAEELAEMRSAQPHGPGAPVRSIEIRDFLTGAVMRWTVLQGSRSNNYVLRSPSGKTSKPHGTAWIMAKLRGYFLRPSVGRPNHAAPSSGNTGRR
jgi:hypothetical protein